MLFNALLLSAFKLKASLLSSAISKGMDLRTVVHLLNQYCSPHLADSWDNVGLLVEPSKSCTVSRVLVTNDLTEPVLNEAVKIGANLIISYHPPIFTPLKRITSSHWKHRLVAECLENHVAVYSPHTGLDANLNGINDWLLSPFALEYKKPITSVPYNKESSVNFTFPMSETFTQFCLKYPGISAGQLSIDGVTAKLRCSASNAQSVLGQAKSIGLIPVASDKIEVDSAHEGYGRIGWLQTPMDLKTIVKAYKTLLGVDSLLLALAYGKQLDQRIRTIAVCAGSGSSILNDKTLAQVADLFVTGEMSHHDRLDAVSRGTSVIIAGHSNTERGFLATRFVPEIRKVLNEEKDRAIPDSLSIEVSMSNVDCEPGSVV